MAGNVDHHNRKITYLRVSVTDRCNLRCMYCVPVKDLKLLNHGDILSYEEILKVLQAAAEIGIEKVRLTGGEPLVRRHFVHLVECVCRVPALKDVSITTNGVHLKERAQEIFDAGVHRINVSLDTLNPVKYAKIAGRDCFHDVWEGLQEAEVVGFSPIKVNVVAIRGINDDELFEFAQLSVKSPTIFGSSSICPSDMIAGGNLKSIYLRTRSSLISRRWVLSTKFCAPSLTGRPSDIDLNQPRAKLASLVR